MIKYIFHLLLIVVIVSCRGKVSSKFINTKNELWRVVQDGEIKRDSSLYFFKVKSDGTFEELSYYGKEYVKLKLNGDIKDYHTWKIIDDSTISFSFITYRIETINDSIFLAINQKHPSDTIKLIRYRVGSN